MKKRKLIYRMLALLLLALISMNIQVPQAQAATKFNAKTAKKNLTLKYYELSDGILLICKNKNDYPVKLEGKVTFLDAGKNNLAISEDQNNCLGAKQTCALFYKAPADGNSSYMAYSSYKKSLKVSKCPYKSYSSKIKASTELHPTGFDLSVSNKSSKKLNVIRISLVIYGDSGDITGYIQKYATCYDKDTSITETVDYPVSCTSHKKIKVYVDTAYKY
ncbi:hypothetical protein AALB53_06200 [Lachnospiraceae bacterium 47-T17]